GFTMIRKKDKLPGPTIGHDYALEYGTDTIEIQADAVEKGQRVVILDDLLATGGTMAASIELFTKVGADVVGTACIIELAFLDGRSRLDGVPFDALIAYDE
ncbi:MAG: purine phosphoribosyltransferase family protein, partial [Rhodospirillales bacterium]